MSIPNNITKEHLLKAIAKIDLEGVPADGDSQYYDVVYNDKRYPPKLVVSYANIYANGDVLDRNSFSGGLDTPCFKILTQNGFAIENKSMQKTPQPNVWFVAQGSTYTFEKGMKYLFAPAKGKDERQRFYWDNLLKVKKGDIIFHYSEGLKGVSIATSDGYNTKEEDPTSQWASEGFRVDVDLTPLSPSVSRNQLAGVKSQLDTYLSSIGNKPFNSSGGVNQGYLYEFTAEAGRLIRDIYGKQFGNKIIDEYFDKVKLSEQQFGISEKLDFDHNVFYKQARAANYFINEKLSRRFISCLLTKRFVILTGLSGSGKTKLAQAFAKWISEKENQYCIVPVGADWTNREPLLGFPNALKSGEYVKPDNRVLDLIIDANSNIDKPYFLILDEMNLSHVERYFADFLSVMESKGKISLHSGKDEWSGIPPEIGFPQNLFVIGTVNIDETTYMFSPKVLDRANVIEFRVTSEEMEGYLQSASNVDLESLEGIGANMANSFAKIANDNSLRQDINDDLNKSLMNFFSQLKRTGSEFGYRSASEILRYVAVMNKMEPDLSLDEILDSAIMQKLLPKVHGSRRKLEPVLKTLGMLCIAKEQKIEDFISPKPDIDFSDATKIKYPISLEKILRMYDNLISNGFTSYAEA